MTTKKTKTTNAKLSEIAVALENAWKCIQEKEKGVRPCIFTVFAGRPKKNGEYTMGYFWANRWTDVKDKTRTDELHINSYILKEGAETVFRVVLHEAVHSWNCEAGIQDVSRGNRYHNKHFKRQAEVFGLTTAPHPTIGVLTPDMTDATKKKYKACINEISKAIKAYQEMIPPGTGKESQPNRSLKATCGCGTIIRISREVAEKKTITCLECEELFKLDE